jgi:hypothetical protein
MISPIATNNYAAFQLKSAPSSSKVQHADRLDLKFGTSALYPPTKKGFQDLNRFVRYLILGLVVLTGIVAIETCGNDGGSGGGGGNGGGGNGPRYMQPATAPAGSYQPSPRR